jgi:pantoate--beta-alanine ligase
MYSTGSIEELRAAIKAEKLKGKTIGFVPTMGALHEGHLSLVELSRKNCDYTVMSIFVNKIQFNDPGDYAKYPRVPDADLALARNAGVDLVFTPNDEVMYKNPLAFVDVEYLDEELCGAHRPGHFKGVCTVVSKFFNIVQPDIAVFGQKDIQQVIIIEKMVRDLNFPVSIIVAPIIRDADGLAKSSRNIHLSPSERKRALSIHESLQHTAQMIGNGEKNPAVLIEAAADYINRHGTPDSIDYISFVDYNTLHNTDSMQEKSVLAVAAYFGKTRLIDNMIITNGDTITCII